MQKEIEQNGSKEEEEEEEDGDEESDEEMDSDELDDDDERVEGMERMNFDFEAFPPSDEDLEGIEGLLTQIFLRANVDCAGMAKKIVAQAPFGCVYKSADDFEERDDEAADSLVYGVLSIVGLNGGGATTDEEKMKQPDSSISEFLLQRSKKYATRDVHKQFAKHLEGQQQQSAKIALLVNERLLHFPTQISAPAFASIRADYESMGKKDRFEHILAILKIRISQQEGGDSSAANGGGGGNSASTPGGEKGRKKKMGKAEKKRRMAARLAEAETIFDNAEEEMLFTAGPQFPFFQYPVESDVEKGSKFHCIRRDGRIFRPYRRVCLLSEEQFAQFADTVAKQTNL